MRRCRHQVRENITRLYFPACVLHDILDSAGLPHTYEKSPVSFLCGIHAAALSEREAEEVLSGGIFLDALAAEILVGKGLGSLIRRNLSHAPALCGGGTVCHAGNISRLFTEVTCRAASRSRAPSEDLSGNRERRNVAFCGSRPEHLSGSYRFRNRLGGRIAVLPYEIRETADNVAVYHLICHQREKVFHALTRTGWTDAPSPAVFRTVRKS
ncbi:MAG: hypothetical protein V8T87_04935 [Victivallales bacterium]